MSDTNDTRPEPPGLQDAGVIEAARAAAAILQLPTPPVFAEEDRQTVFLEGGAGLVFAITNEGRFQMASTISGNPRPFINLTFEETRALFRFWVAVCTPVLMQHIAQGVELVKAQRAKEETHGND